MIQSQAKLFIIVAAILTVGSQLVVTQAQAQSAARCDAYARDVSWRASRGGALGGAARGFVGGAVVGRIFGGKRGARRGRRIGAVAGGTVGAVRRGKTYNRAYSKCMSGRIY